MISVQVTGESVRLKVELLRKKTLGFLEVLGMSETILEGALVKKRFKAFAMEVGSVCLIPFSKISEIGSRFLPPESIAERSMSQVFLRLQ